MGRSWLCSYGGIKTMKVSVEDAGGGCTVHMAGVPLSVANGLRRACLANVTVPAFERLVVRINTSNHPDEVLAHRLGLMVLRGTGGDGTATMRLRCTEREQLVTLADFEWPENIEPVHPTTPLVTLTRGQQLDLQVTAAWGSGADHAKFCPVSRAALKHADAPDAYALEIDSRNQHPALAVAVMAAEQLIESLQSLKSV